MIWLTWRQFRTQGLTTLAILAAAAVYFLATGLHMHHAYALDLVGCRPVHDCGDVLGQLRQGYDGAVHLTQLLVIMAPGLIGIFWGAPLVGRELESGTDQLVWNQSVTRTRWLAIKLAGVGLASMTAVGLLSYMLTWWIGPLDQITSSRFDAMSFASRDIVPLAYAALAFALGTTAGLFLRRTLPAMAVTLGLFMGLQILMPTVIRPHLLTSSTVVLPINGTTGNRFTGIYTSGGGADFHLVLPLPPGAWVTSAPPVVNSAGNTVPAYRYTTCLFPSAGGPPDKGGAPPVSQAASCLAPYDLHESVTYQPASHFWPLQWAESGIYLALAAALSSSCFWWIRRRTS